MFHNTKTTVQKDGTMERLPKRPQQQRRRQPTVCRHWWPVAVTLCVATGILWSSVKADSNVYLQESTSVVLITGAAGFLGSELTMALHRTYRPKKIICVDSMDAGFGEAANATTLSEADLALFEFKRQRVFHMLQQQQQLHDSGLFPSIFFYRVDFRPSIPEYFDTAEVPVLHHIFEEHSDITHVIHLADHIHRANPSMSTMQQHNTVIPRIKGQEKAGMMESLLEELLLQRERTKLQIQFVYASSGEVYNHFVVNQDENSPNLPPFSEAKPLTTPSTVAGATKLVDELLAQAYFDIHGIASTALRFFNVYGPWGLPGSPLFVMAERAILGQDPVASTNEPSLDDISDYIYIDDAVDAIMAALQFQSPFPNAISFNVGSGEGTSLRTIARQMRSLAGLPATTSSNNDGGEKSSTVSFADMDRSSTLLGFAPRMALDKGLANLMAWHHDRAFPYGSGYATNSDPLEPKQARGMLAQCDRFDTECLRGTPVFPCASECAHETQCHGTPYDDVLDLTRAITASCPVVLYTVALGTNVTHLQSSRVRVSTQSVAYVEQNEAGGDGSGVHCNIAFVSDTSPLFISLAEEESRRRRSSAAVTDGVVKHGFWSLIPISVTEFTRESIPMLSLLPKLSPSKFFADAVEHAVYCDPDVIFDNLPRLILESKMQPKHPSIPGATVMLIGNKPVDIAARQRPLQATDIPTPPRRRIQEDAYRMIRVAVIDEMVGDGLSQKLDAGFVVHTLRRLSGDDDDGRMFRCDVFGDVLQWQVDTDVSALEFILGLHDMWSRVMVKRSGLAAWWVGDDVASVSKRILERKRRLQEHGSRRNEADGTKQSRKAKKNEAVEDEDDEVSSNEVDEIEKNSGGEHNGFGAIEDVAGARKSTRIIETQKAQQRFERPTDEEEDNDFVVDDDDTAENNPLRGARGTDDGPSDYLPNSVDQDPSSYDVWMGVLSSTQTRYFCRIVSMDAVGVYHITENDTDETYLVA